MVRNADKSETNIVFLQITRSMKPPEAVVRYERATTDPGGKARESRIYEKVDDAAVGWRMCRRDSARCGSKAIASELALRAGGADARRASCEHLLILSHCIERGHNLGSVTYSDPT